MISNTNSLRSSFDSKRKELICSHSKSENENAEKSHNIFIGEEDSRIESILCYVMKAFSRFVTLSQQTHFIPRSGNLNDAQSVCTVYTVSTQLLCIINGPRWTFELCVWKKDHFLIVSSHLFFTSKRTYYLRSKCFWCQVTQVTSKSDGILLKKMKEKKEKKSMEHFLCVTIVNCGKAVTNIYHITRQLMLSIVGLYKRNPNVHCTSCVNVCIR